MKCRPIFSIALVVTALVGTIYSVQGTIPFFALNPNGQVAAVTGAIGKTYEVRTVAELISARDSIRALPRDASWKGATVALHGGYYNFTSSFVLDSRDSGTSAYPVIYMNYPGEQAIISGAKQISSSWFSKVSVSTPNFSKIQSGVSGNVYVADLKANGITDYGILQKMGYGSNLAGKTGFDRSPNSAMEILFNDKVMTLARWPNVGVNEPDNAAKDNAVNGWVRITSIDPNKQPGFQLPGTRWQNWLGNTDMRFLGLYYSTWTDNTLGGKVDSKGYVNLSEGPVSVNYITEPSEINGSGRHYIPVAALNVLQELDVPGEYYIDRTNGLLYFYPPASLSGARISGSAMEDRVIIMDGVGYVTLNGVIVEGSRDDLIKVERSHHLSFEDMIFRNGGNDAITFDELADSSITRSIFHGLGGGGVALAHVGSRGALASGNVSITNSEFYDISRLHRTGGNSAIKMAYYGNVGVRVANNYFHDMPFIAVQMYGNDNITEYNRFKNINYEYPDSGIVYSYADWAEHDSIIRYNIFENSVTVYPHFGIKIAGSNVYLDGASSGFNIYGNIMYNSQSIGVLVNSGHDNKITNNVISGSYSCVVINGRTVNNAGHYKSLHDALKGHNYQSSTWKAKIPTVTAIPSDWALVDGSKWFDPIGTRYEKNICVDFGAPNEWGDKDIGGSGAYTVSGLLGTNYHGPSYDPKFVNAGAGNFNFQSSSPVNTISGFPAIPVSKIGILEPRRTSGAVFVEQVVSQNGICGTNLNSCVNGTLSDTTDSSTNYLWSCNGLNGGTNASCMLAKTIIPTPVSGICGSTNNSCSTGTLSDTADSSTNYIWQCLGSNGGSTASCSVAKPVTTTTQTIPGVSSPYKGAPQTIPGTVEAENYNEGGEGVAYHDSDTGNNGKIYRNDNVDLGYYGNTYHIGWFKTGEWFEYTVRATETARYSVALNLSNPSAGGAIKISIDGKDVATVNVPTRDSSWTARALSDPFEVDITAGLHTIRVAGVTNGAGGAGWVGDLDALIFAKKATASTKFKTGDSIKTTSSINVRASASSSGTLTGTQASNSIGTIVGGPIYADGYYWWNVDYLLGSDGWSVETYLIKYTAQTDPVSYSGAKALVGHWKFDETSGTSAGDSSGKGNTGTLIGQASVVNDGTCKFGSCLKPNSKAPTGVSIPDSPSLDTPQEMSVSAWVNYTGDIKNSYYNEIAQKNNIGDWKLRLFESGGRYEFSVSNTTGGGGYCIPQDEKITTNTWHHLVGTVSVLTGKINLYVDGVNVCNGTMPGTALKTSDGRVIIGSTETSGIWNGLIDDVRIYNYALPGTEISALYEKGVPPKPTPNASGIIGYWKFDETSGTTATDSSGIGHNGTLTNGPLITTSGKIGGALKFDGVNDRVVAQAVPRTGTDVNVSLWINKSGWMNHYYAPLVEQGGPKGFRLVMLANKSICFGSDTELDNFYCTPNIVTDYNVWYHINAGFNGSYYIYINGELQTLTQRKGQYGANAPWYLYIGDRDYNSDVDAFRGLIDEVKIYDRALSPTEAKAIYDSAGSL